MCDLRQQGTVGRQAGRQAGRQTLLKGKSSHSQPSCQAAPGCAKLNSSPKLPRCAELRQDAPPQFSPPSPKGASWRENVSKTVAFGTPWGLLVDPLVFLGAPHGDGDPLGTFGGSWGYGPMVPPRGQIQSTKTVMAAKMEKPRTEGRGDVQPMRKDPHVVAVVTNIAAKLRR